jgi:hypothetical protein
MPRQIVCQIDQARSVSLVSDSRWNLADKDCREKIASIMDLGILIDMPKIPSIIT